MSKPKKNRILGKLILLLVLILLLITAIKILPYILSKQEEKIALLQDNIKILKKETIPIRFKVIERRNNISTIQIKFYDINDKEISSNTIKVVGDELNFDFSVVKQNLLNAAQDKTYLFFPMKVFSDEIAPENGVSLIEFYNKDGFPLIYRGVEFTKDTKESFSGLFYLISKNEKVSDFTYGNAVHDVKTISSFKKGFVYDIVCHTHSGGIEIVKE